MDDIIKENMDVHFDIKVKKNEGVYDFKRIAVLYEHISKFDLPKNPDKDVLTKLKDDPRRGKFMEKYNLKDENGNNDEDQLFQIEIDALAAADPGALKKMILGEIEPLYDKEIYKRLLSDPNHSEKQISLLVRKNVQLFLEELRQKYGE